MNVTQLSIWCFSYSYLEWEDWTFISTSSNHRQRDWSVRCSGDYLYCVLGYSGNLFGKHFFALWALFWEFEAKRAQIAQKGKNVFYKDVLELNFATIGNSALSSCENHGILIYTGTWSFTILDTVSFFYSIWYNFNPAAPVVEILDRATIGSVFYLPYLFTIFKNLSLKPHQIWIFVFPRNVLPYANP